MAWCPDSAEGATPNAGVRGARTPSVSTQVPSVYHGAGVAG
eukprot:CAMPEP_0119404668 /NCGR_PEP_ID=MMETSP1334-20130426/144012_1 /TAXON_ID=127549 /ORGANISM="Calcidiscus leptoporus, Strain RCC1130" /LENGTH=40 /DNA_ID= /DNA_START= /DNA_END= /DNA_ORIENTATION=